MEMNGGMADQEKQFLLRVSRMKFTEKYKEEVTESEVSLMKAAGFENPDPAQIEKLFKDVLHLSVMRILL